VKHHLKSHRGFTLIEVIVTLIVSSILAVLLIQVMQGHNERSLWPLTKTKEGLFLDQVMENISADYRALLLSDATPLATLKSRIDGGAGSYWSGRPVQIVENMCLADIHKDDEPSPGEYPPGGVECTYTNDRLLKVTLTYNGQSLTALFTR
jgi:prepilin-type N-terminal cleavage/methylation domain-containing protein